MHELAILTALAVVTGCNIPSASGGLSPPAATSVVPVIHRGGMTPMDLPSLVENSQFVWKGEITAASNRQAVAVTYLGRTVEAAAETLTFRVDRVIKGALPGSQTPSFDLYTAYRRGPMWGRRGGPFVPGWYGIVFLSEKDHHLVVTDAFYPGIQVGSSLAPAVATADAMAVVEAELINTLQGPEHSLVQAAADHLVKLHSQPAIRPLHQLANSPDPVCAGTAYAALLRLGDTSRLALSVAFVQDHGPPPGTAPPVSYSGRDNVEWVRASLLGAISTLQDEAAAPLLNPLLQNSDPLVRRAVAAALRRMCHASSMPYFAAALDDPDLYVAAAAMRALLETHQRQNWTPEEWAEYRRIGSGTDLVPEWHSGMLPAWEQFEANPEPYRDFWKNWWQTEGKALYGTTGESPLPNG